MGFERPLKHLLLDHERDARQVRIVRAPDGEGVGQVDGQHEERALPEGDLVTREVRLLGARGHDRDARPGDRPAGAAVGLSAVEDEKTCFKRLPACGIKAGAYVVGQKIEFGNRAFVGFRHDFLPVVRG